MIRTLIILSIALLTSAGVNLLQWRSAAVSASEHRAAIDAAVERGRLESAQLASSRAAGIAVLRATDELEIYRLRQWALNRPAQLVTVYRDRIRDAEVPVCRVSASQVAAVNEVLR